MSHQPLEFTDIHKFDPQFQNVKLGVKTFSEKNLIMLARESQHFMQMYLDILAQDYMLYMHQDQISYFIRRKEIHTIWQRKDLIQYEDLFYSITEIPPEKENSLAPKRLVVVFSPMNSQDKYASANIGDRCFATGFRSIQKHLIKNTLIMRIMDLNVSHGSHYINSKTYPTMEDDVQGAIRSVSHMNNIHKDNIILYGESKGGTGALYHGLLGNYYSVSIDPIIDLTYYNNSNDAHFLKYFRAADLLPKMKELGGELGQRIKYIFGSPAVPLNYSQHKKLEVNTSCVQIIDVFDSAVNKHIDISKNCRIEQITCMNNILLNSAHFKNECKRLEKIFQNEIN